MFSHSPFYKSVHLCLNFFYKCQTKGSDEIIHKVKHSADG